MWPNEKFQDAIAKDSFFSIVKRLSRGDVDAAFSSSDHVVEDSFRTAAQEHFYLETNASLVVPGKEDDELEIFASTQNPTETQHLVAHVMGVGSHKVTCRVSSFLFCVFFFHFPALAMWSVLTVLAIRIPGETYGRRVWRQGVQVGPAHLRSGSVRSEIQQAGAMHAGPRRGHGVLR
jgi:hypothetical protein